MNTISKRIHIASILTWPVFFFGGSIANYIYMNNTIEQTSKFTLLNFYLLCFMVVLSQIVLYVKMQPIDNAIKTIDKLTADELKKLSIKVLNFPIFHMVKTMIFYFVFVALWYFIYRYYSISHFASSTVIFVGTAGLLGVASSIFFLTGFLLKSINKSISIKLKEGNIKVSGIKFSIRNKIIMSVFSIGIAMTIFLLALVFYYSVNRTIETKLESYQLFQENLLSNNYLNIDNETDKEEIIKKINHLKFVKIKLNIKLRTIETSYKKKPYSEISFILAGISSMLAK